MLAGTILDSLNLSAADAKRLAAFLFSPTYASWDAIHDIKLPGGFTVWEAIQKVEPIYGAMMRDASAKRVEEKWELVPPAKLVAKAIRQASPLVKTPPKMNLPWGSVPSHEMFKAAWDYYVTGRGLTTYRFSFKGKDAVMVRNILGFESEGEFPMVYVYAVVVSLAKALAHGMVRAEEVIKVILRDFGFEWKRMTWDAPQRRKAAHEERVRGVPMDKREQAQDLWDIWYDESEEDDG